MADRLLSCASAHSDNIQLLKEQGRDVSSFYQVLGYFETGGKAYSSTQYAERKFSEYRDESQKRLKQAMSAPGPDAQQAKLKEFGDNLKKKLLDCADFQRKNADLITARIKTSGVLEK